MGGPALLHTVTFGAVIVMILLTVWIVLMLESGGDPPRADEGATTPSDHPGQAAAQEHKDA
jgi:hypothetical protein